MENIIAHTRSWAARFGLAGLGALSAALWVYVSLALPTSNRRAHVALFLLLFAALFALYFCAVAGIGRARLRAPVGAIFFFAVVFRLLAVGAGLPSERTLAHFADDLGGRRVAYEPFLLYDNDLWRYLWDGHALAEGIDPYQTTPRAALDDDEVAGRLLTSESWRDVHDAVSFRNYGTIYPPLIHYFFAALARLAPASAGAAKLALALIDVLLCFVLWRVLGAAGRRPELVAVYAWNPTVIKEISGSGHPDVLMMLALVVGAYLLAEGRAASAGAALAASLLAKLATAVTLPFLAVWSMRWSGRAALARATLAGAAVLALGLWPLAQGLGAWLDALGVFAQRWTFNSGVWAAVRWALDTLGAARPERLAHALTRTAIVAAALWVAFRAHRSPRDPRDRAGRVEGLFHGLFHSLAVLVLLSPAVMPWYVLWALPAAVVAGNRWWPAFTGLALLSYLNYADGIGAAAWWKWLEYGALAAIVAWDRFRPGSVPRRPQSPDTRAAADT